MTTESKTEDTPIRRSVPWWLHLLLAIIAYIVFAYLLPSIRTADPAIEKFLNMSPKAAPILAIVFLLLTANALYKDDPPPDSSTRESEQEKEPPSPQ